jgi:hypothetical protein
MLQNMMSSQGNIRLSPHAVLTLLEHICLVYLQRHERACINGTARSSFELSSYLLLLFTNKVFSNSQLQLPPPQSTNIADVWSSVQKGTREWTKLLPPSGTSTTRTLGDVTTIYLCCLALAAENLKMTHDGRYVKLVSTYVTMDATAQACQQHPALVAFNQAATGGVRVNEMRRQALHLRSCSSSRET